MPRRSSRLNIWTRYIIWSCLAWLIAIHWCESISPRSSIGKCNWSRWESSKMMNPYHIGLFADPQIMDKHSYPGRPAVLNNLTRLILDRYHRRNWKIIQKVLDPDANIFLGDLFDGGRYWDDAYWMDEFKRFNSIFRQIPGKRNIMTLPGNHDIGFGDTVLEDSLRRFRAYFGETSASWDLGNHTIVLLDTISLSHSSNPSISNHPRQFLGEFRLREPHQYPRILLTHVPLWRNENQQRQCGSMRESKRPFPIQKGDQYQTVIDAEISQNVLASIEPDLIFSGDDHDYCHIVHNYRSNGHDKTADEITVKSCAMNMGINKPAIQLLSLHNDGSSKNTYDTNICYLPDPYRPFYVYITLAIFNLLFFLYAYCSPQSFNKNIGIRIAKIMHKIGLEENLEHENGLPMPVSAAQSHFFENSNYILPSNSGFINFILNSLLVFFSVTLVFGYYYTML